MKRILLATVIMLSLVFSFVGTAQAVTDGELDGNGHPYVGLMVAQDADGIPLWRCSGTLIAPTCVPDCRALYRSAGCPYGNLVCC